MAFVDILGFKGLVENSAIADDAVSIARTLERLCAENDRAFYREYGAEICPDSPKIKEDLSLQITQVSDCVILSAEVSPAGAINIINHCRKVAERLLLREGLLCQGYVAKGKVYHRGTVIFGPAYQEAVDGEKTAAAIEWEDGSLGTPFIEVDQAVSSYIADCGDECTRKLFSRMTTPHENCSLISPYGVFSRMTSWVFSPDKTPKEMRREIKLAENIIGAIEKSLSVSTPVNERASEKIRISLEKLSEARRDLIDAVHMIEMLAQPAILKSSEKRTK